MTLALDFATVENILCVARDGLAIGFLRALFAVPAHALFGAAMGFYVGRAKLGDGQWQGIDVTRRQRRQRWTAALAVPVAFHGGYDFLLKVVAKDLDAYKAFTLETLLSMPDVQDIRTSIVLDLIKNTAELPLPAARAFT